MSETVYLEGPGGDLLVAHGPDMGQVRRLVEKEGFEKLSRMEFIERADGRDPDEGGRRWTYSSD